MKSGVRARLLAPGGVLLAGVVLFLLVSSAYGGPPSGRRRVIKAASNVANTSTVALNNSVVVVGSPPEDVILSPNTEAPCTEGECIAANKSAEELVPVAKGTSGDPLVRTNHIGLTRYAAGSIADEIQERVQADLQNRRDQYRNNVESSSLKPEATLSSFDERLSRLSDVVNSAMDRRIVPSSVEVQKSLPTITGTGLVVAEAKDGETWQSPPSPVVRTPELPHKYSKEAGYISTSSYDESTEPNKFAKSSTKYMDEGTSTGFTSTSQFSYSEAMTPAIKPSSVTLVLTSTSSYDRQESGSSEEDEDKESDPEEVKEAATSNNATIVVVKNDTIVENQDTVTSATNITNKIFNANETQVINLNQNNDTILVDSNKNIDVNIKNNTDIEDMLNLNKTEINSKISLLEKETQSKKENESITKNVTTEKTDIPAKVLDLEESMAGQVVTIAAVNTQVTLRRRTRPTSTTTPEPQSSQDSPVTLRSVRRGSTRFSAVPEAANVTTESAPATEGSSPVVTTYRGERSSTVRPRRVSTPGPRGSRRPSTTTPVPDTQGEESSLECTTTEESLETAVTPADEGGVPSVHRSTTFRSRSTAVHTRGPPRGRPRTRPPHVASTSDAEESKLFSVQVSTEEASFNSTDWDENNTTELSTTSPDDDVTTSSPSDTSSSDVTEAPAVPSDDEEEYPDLGIDPTINSTSSTSSTSTTSTTTQTTSEATSSASPEENTVPHEPEPASTSVPSPVKAFLRLTVATSWEELCRDQDEFRQGLASLLTKGTGREVSSERVVLLNDEQCLEPPETEAAGIPLRVYLEDEAGHYDMQLTEAFPQIWGRDSANQLQITCVDLRYTKDEQVSPATGENANVIAAIAISGVAAGCLLLLVIIMLVMRKRQKRYNYGQRCTPVSLDAYSLDSVSVYNSVRRKGALRASKRSYGNPAFDDPESPSHPVNFAGLANCLSDPAAMHEEFALVPVVSARMDELPPGAESKNRYANVIPLPETRVALTMRGSDLLSEYINANFVRGPKNAPKYYVACQAPLEATVTDFWRMVWEQQSKVILMLTDLEENGVEKCADYLPPSEVLDCHRRFGDYHVTLKKREVRDKYVISTLQLKNMETSLWREVTHLWYFGWPATGVPDEATSVIAFIIEARSFMKSNSGPTVVHCSPGTGRTGTILAIDLCIRDFEQSRLVDVPRTVHRLRRDRAGAVQTREQYVFIYQVLNVYAAKLTGGAMDSF